LATGGMPMEIRTPGYHHLGYAAQEPANRRRNLEEAIRSFQTVLLLEPDNLEAKYNQAVCFHDDALSHLDDGRNYLRELASSTNYGWARAGMFGLGCSLEDQDPRES